MPLPLDLISQDLAGSLACLQLQIKSQKPLGPYQFPPPELRERFSPEQLGLVPALRSERWLLFRHQRLAPSTQAGTRFPLAASRTRHVSELTLAFRGPHSPKKARPLFRHSRAWHRGLGGSEHSTPEPRPQDQEQSYPNHWQLHHFHRGPCGLSPSGHGHTKPPWLRALGFTTHIPLSKVLGRTCVHCQVGLPIPDHKCAHNDLVQHSMDSCPLGTYSQNPRPSPFPTRRLPGSRGRSDDGYKVCVPPPKERAQSAQRPLKVGPLAVAVGLQSPRRPGCA